MRYSMVNQCVRYKLSQHVSKEMNAMRLENTWSVTLWKDSEFPVFSIHDNICHVLLVACVVL